MSKKTKGWSVRWDALLDVPKDPDYPFRVAEQLEAAGADGPTVGGGQQYDRIDARFDVQASGPLEAVERAWQIWAEVFPDAEVVAFESQTADEFDRQNATPNFPHLAGPQELAAILGVSRQRLYEITKMEGFPKPVVQLAGGPVWDVDSLNHFRSTWSRKPGRRPALPHIIPGDGINPTTVVAREVRGTKRSRSHAGTDLPT